MTSTVLFIGAFRRLDFLEFFMSCPDLSESLALESYSSILTAVRLNFRTVHRGPFQDRQNAKLDD